MTHAAPEFDILGCTLDGEHLIEASAGTGKTWNICALYLRLLVERDFEVSRILVVTFTNAAAAELRNRVRKRIVELLQHLDASGSEVAPDAFLASLVARFEAGGGKRDDLHKKLDAARQHFDEAAIFTIHGFCQRALADAPFASALPFALELIQDDAELRAEVVNDFWRRHVAGDDLPAPLVAHLVQQKDSPERWSRLVARRLAKPLAAWRWPEGETPAPDTAALDAAFHAARELWSREGPAIVALLTGPNGLNKGSYKPHQVQAVAAGWERFLQAGDPLGPIDEAWKLQAFGATMLAKKTNKGQATPQHPFFSAAQALLDARADVDRRLALGRLALLRRLIDEAPDDLRRRKRERRVVGYDDLLWNLHAALAGADGAALAEKLRSSFPAALIDEFQDTDPLQFGIFERIYGGTNAPWFLVGDPKQAIYGFRHADVHAYLAARAQAGSWTTLAANQRATPELIAALNALFGANERAFVLEAIDYVPVHAGERPHPVLCDAGAPRANLQIWMLPHGDGALLNRASALDAAAAATAAEVARLLAAAERGEVRLGERQLAARDIAVLVRSHAHGRRMRDALARLAVGSIELARETIFATADAEDVGRVLAAIAEPANTSLARAALATGLLGWDAARIEATGADEHRLAAVAERFARYRDDWQARGFGVMFRRMLVGEAVTSRMLARDDGERRLTNLRHLGELLQEAAQRQRTPDALLHWLEAQRREPGADDARQLRLESDRNLVQIVTIHKAKGLEYPVTFCPLLWDGHRQARNDPFGALEYHDTDGRAVVDFRAAADAAGEPAAHGLDRDAIAQRIRLEAAAEDARLLYVALTRASHRCYLVAGGYGTGSSLSPKESARTLLNWLAAGGGIEPAVWLDKDRNPATVDGICAAWGALAARAPGAVGVAPLPVGAGTPLASPPVPIDRLVALAPPAHIANAWRIGSFSSLQHGALRESAASDHDARVAPPTSSSAPSAVELSVTDILRFPRGRGAGDCLHAVFERCDFGDPATWDPAIAGALREHPQPGDPARLASMIASMLGDVMTTTLPGGFALRDIAPARRLVELEFHLPAPQLAPAALQQALRALGHDAPRLAAPVLEGYLKGFIDLVFEHDGRHYVLDWKSNHLGNARDDYGPTRLDEAMAEHGYHLQSLLYALALDRLLRHRLPRYDHATQFGGVLYLFVRGVRPGWVNGDGTPSGVVFQRPSATELQRFGAALGASAMDRAA